ncbi:glutathione S-transferase D6-like [Malaya genurostris]|uniref:glutathione S-transferase D6-like n=1 Tax=Malaya genurostris TaxID=325434 RepID=UPI0026F3803F|nr:glutathione S-transferase D6-like [Malaya genurostris]
MDLYYHIIPPTSRAILVLANILKLKLNLISIDTKDANEMEMLSKINPLQSLPTLVDGEIVVGESHTVLIYLAEKFDKAGTLYPVDQSKRTKINECLFFDTNMYKCFVAYSMPVVLKGMEPNEELMEKLLVCVRTFDRYLENRSYAACDHLTVADVSLFQTIAALAVIDIQKADYANVNRWYEKVHSEMTGSDEFQAQCERALRAFLAKQLPN